jgi:argininosuccinate synthase
MKRIVLAYSGSAATANSVRWLAVHHGAEVVTLTLDLGQGKELEAVRDRAFSIGAARAHVLDVHDQFIRGYLLRAFKAGALFDGERSLVAALSRPLIAERLVEVARIEQAADVAHTCAPDDDRIAVAVHSLEPALNVIAVPRDGTVAASTPRPAGPAPKEAAFVDISFERGTPAAINGIAMPLADLVGSLDIIARAHGVVDALRVLSAAHRQLQQTVTPKAGDDLRQRYASIIDRGEWFSPERADLDAAVTKAQDKVSGSVRLKLFQGGSEIVSCQPSKPPKKLTVIA